MTDFALPAPGLSRRGGPSGRHRVHLIAALFLLAAIFAGAGLLGIYSYVNNFSLYRGYAPPKDPSFVKVAGATQTIPWQARHSAGERSR